MRDLLVSMVLVVTCFLLPGCITTQIGVQLSAKKPKLVQKSSLDPSPDLEAELSLIDLADEEK